MKLTYAILFNLLFIAGFAIAEDGKQEDSFALSNEEIEQASQQLLEEEAKLLKELEGGNVKLENNKNQITEVENSSVHEIIVKSNTAPKLEVKPAVSQKITQEDNDKSEKVADALNHTPEVAPPSPCLVDQQLLESEKKGLQTKIDTQARTIRFLRQDNQALKTKQEASELLTSSYEEKLQEAKRRLLMAETELERLSTIIQRRNSNSAPRQVFDHKKTGPNQNIGENRVKSPAHPENQKVDMPVATVMADNANLRVGPGESHSALMSVTKGTRLIVEKRQKDWYRVISPTGGRAWISSSVVAFGRDPFSSPSRTVKIQGFDSDAEKEAFKLIKNGPLK